MDRRHILIVIARSLIYIVQFCMGISSSSGILQEIPPSLSCLRLEDHKSLVGSCPSLQRELQLWAPTIREDLPLYEWTGLYWILERGSFFYSAYLRLRLSAANKARYLRSASFFLFLLYPGFSTGRVRIRCTVDLTSPSATGPSVSSSQRTKINKITELKLWFWTQWKTCFTLVKKRPPGIWY